jgi:hypothetical protein
VLERQRAPKREPSVLPPAAPTLGSKGQVDVFGNQVPPIALDQVACPNCSRKVAAGRCARRPASPPPSRRERRRRR